MKLTTYKINISFYWNYIKNEINIDGLFKK